MMAVWPRAGGVFISVLICISALGAVNGLIFTGARISYAVGTDHRLFRWLGRWHPRLGTLNPLRVKRRRAVKPAKAKQHTIRSPDISCPHEMATAWSASMLPAYTVRTA